MKASSLLLSTILTTLLCAEGELALNDMKLYSLEELMNLTVSEIATGTPLEEKFVPGSISIITAKQIEENGARTFYEALEQVPGLHVYPGKSFAMRKGISIRGIQSITNPHVLIMIDGVSLGTGYYGSPAMFFKMPSSIIEKIEVIRGPGSALYGADAFSGVVNIISKKYENIEDLVSLRYGSFETLEGYSHLNTKVGDLELGLSMSYVTTDGDASRVVEEDGLKGADHSLAPGPLNTGYETLYLHSDAHYKSFDLNIMASQTENAGTASGAAQILDPRGEINNQTFLIDLKHTNTTLLKDTTIKSNIAYTYYDVSFVYGVSPVGSPAAFEDGVTVIPGLAEDNYFINTRAIYEGLNDHVISVGIGYRNSTMKNLTWKTNVGAGVSNPGIIEDLTGTEYTFMKEGVSRDNIYGLLQDEYKIFDSLSFIAGVRYDHYSDFGGTTNPRLALIWQQSDSLTIKSMYGKAFRAPAFSELYLRNNALSLGNENLKPEVIDTYEVIFDYRAPVYTKLNLFYYEAKDLITYVADVDATSKTAQNQAGINGYGLELDLSYDVHQKVNLSANYAYVHAEYEDTKLEVADVAPHQVFAQIQYKPAVDWNINTQFFYFSKRSRVDTDTRADLDASNLVHLTVKKRNFIKNLDAIVAIRNLFDTNYKEPSDGKIAGDYPMEGINIFAELKYRF